jgi:hypothetical protein
MKHILGIVLRMVHHHDQVVLVDQLFQVVLRDRAGQERREDLAVRVDLKLNL